MKNPFKRKQRTTIELMDPGKEQVAVAFTMLGKLADSCDEAGHIGAAGLIRQLAIAVHDTERARKR